MLYFSSLILAVVLLSSGSSVSALPPHLNASTSSSRNILLGLGMPATAAHPLFKRRMVSTPNSVFNVGRSVGDRSAAVPGVMKTSRSMPEIGGIMGRTFNLYKRDNGAFLGQFASGSTSMVSITFELADDLEALGVSVEAVPEDDAESNVDNNRDACLRVRKPSAGSITSINSAQERDINCVKVDIPRIQFFPEQVTEEKETHVLYAISRILMNHVIQKKKPYYQGMHQIATICLEVHGNNIEESPESFERAESLFETVVEMLMQDNIKEGDLGASLVESMETCNADLSLIFTNEELSRAEEELEGDVPTLQEMIHSLSSKSTFLFLDIAPLDLQWPIISYYMQERRSAIRFMMLALTAHFICHRGEPVSMAARSLFQSFEGQAKQFIGTADFLATLSNIKEDSSHLTSLKLLKNPFYEKLASKKAKFFPEVIVSNLLSPFGGRKAKVPAICADLNSIWKISRVFESDFDKVIRG